MIGKEILFIKEESSERHGTIKDSGWHMLGAGVGSSYTFSYRMWTSRGNTDADTDSRNNANTDSNSDTNTDSNNVTSLGTNGKAGRGCWFDSFGIVC